MILTDDAPLLVCLSDLHCGSSRALMPPGFRDTEDQGHEPNRFQDWLWGWWWDFHEWIERVAGDSPYSLLLNGDLIEGVHHGTTQLVTNDPADHAKIALEVLAPLSERAERVYMVIGTEVHTKTTEHSIAQRLGCVPSPLTRQPCHEKLWLRQNGVLIAVSHHIGTTGRQALEATQLSIQLTEDQAQAARIGDPIPQMIVRSHRHVYGYYTDGDGSALVLPSWQFLTRHGHKVVPAARQRFGGAILDWRNVGANSLPEVRERLYRFRMTGEAGDAFLSQSQFAALGLQDAGGHNAE